MKSDTTEFIPHMSSDDFDMPPMDEEETENTNDDMDFTLPDFDEEEVVVEEKSEDGNNKEVTIEDTEEPKQDVEALDDIDELSSDGVNLADIFKDLENITDKQDEILDKADDGSLSKEDIETLKKTNDLLVKKIEQVNNEKMELLYKNAELETFGNENTTPELLILSKHIKQIEDNPKSKEKVLQTLKRMYEDITGEDIDQENVNDKVNILSAAEQYNTYSNPEIKNMEDLDKYNVVMD